MAIKYHLDAQGGFTVGDTDTNVTRYAFPSSDHALMARKSPARAAAEMLHDEHRYCTSSAFCTIHREAYDAANWATIERGAV